MALEQDVKKAIIDEYATHPGDTGSPEVQVASRTSPSTSRSTSTTTTHVVVCCFWSGSVVVCWATSRTSISRAIAR